MKVSLRGAIEIASHEGIVPMPYRDSVGVWTWGVGHTASAGNPDPAKMPKGVESSLDEVFDVFRRDLVKFENRVNKAVTVPLAQHEFDALVSFDYNSGGVFRAALTKSLNAGLRKAAAQQFMGWSKPKAIIPRRRKEQALFRDGTYSSGGKATVYRADASGKVLWNTGKRVDVAALLGPRSLDPESVPPMPLPPPDNTPPLWGRFWRWFWRKLIGD